MKIWLDDVLAPPLKHIADTLLFEGDDWIWCRTYDQALSFIKSAMRTQTEVVISFDHDLGGFDDAPSGYTLAKYIEEEAHKGNILKITEWWVHSGNPVGRKNIRMAMESYMKVRANA